MHDVAASARRYMATFGRDAMARIDADMSRAIGRTDWDEHGRLRRVRLRIQRLQLLAEAETRLGRLMRLARLVPDHRPPGAAPDRLALSDRP